MSRGGREGGREGAPNSSHRAREQGLCVVLLALHHKPRVRGREGDARPCGCVWEPNWGAGHAGWRHGGRARAALSKTHTTAQNAHADASDPLASIFPPLFPSFPEALPALATSFGAPTTIPPDVLLLWAALGLDAGAADDVAATLERYLASVVVAPGPRGGGGHTVRSPFSSSSGDATATTTAGAVLTVDAYETAARMLLVEALSREARTPARAAAWVAAGGLAPLPEARRAVLTAELEAAAAAVVAEAAAAAAAAAAPPPPSLPHADAAVNVSRTPSDSGGATVALGDGGALLKSASFLAATPERLAELWRGGSAALGAPAASSAPWLPAGVSPTMAAAAVIAAGVAASVAAAERGAVARARRGARRGRWRPRSWSERVCFDADSCTTTHFCTCSDLRE